MFLAVMHTVLSVNLTYANNTGVTEIFTVQADQAGMTDNFHDVVKCAFTELNEHCAYSCMAGSIRESITCTHMYIDRAYLYNDLNSVTYSHPYKQYARRLNQSEDR